MRVGFFVTCLVDLMRPSIGFAAIRLLEAGGADVYVPPTQTCCGFGGSFSVKFGEISARLADNKCQHVANCGADALVLGDLGCMLNIEGRLRRRGDAKTKVLHVAEVLAGERPA